MLYAVLSFVVIAIIVLAILGAIDISRFDLYNPRGFDFPFGVLAVLLSVPFAIWKWIEIFIKAVLWFKSHWV